MPLYSVRTVVDGQRREFALALPPDWFEIFGQMHLVVGFHPHPADAEENERDVASAEAFIHEIQFDDLVNGNLTDDGVRPGVMGIFPQALDLREAGQGTWNCGPMGVDVALL